ncbi:hypothetical protein IAT38_006391 [Cryptococcus sp. DSM 104549]
MPNPTVTSATSPSAAPSQTVMDWMKHHPYPNMQQENSRPTWTPAPTPSTKAAFLSVPQNCIRVVYDPTLNKRLGQSLLNECSDTVPIPHTVEAFDAVNSLVAEHEVIDEDTLVTRLSMMIFFVVNEAITAAMPRCHGRWEDFVDAETGRLAGWRFTSPSGDGTVALARVKLQSDLMGRDAVRETSEGEPRRGSRVDRLLRLCAKGDGLVVGLVQDVERGESIDEITVVNDKGDTVYGIEG